ARAAAPRRARLPALRRRQRRRPPPPVARPLPHPRLRPAPRSRRCLEKGELPSLYGSFSGIGNPPLELQVFAFGAAKPSTTSFPHGLLHATVFSCFPRRESGG